MNTVKYRLAVIAAAICLLFTACANVSPAQTAPAENAEQTVTLPREAVVENVRGSIPELTDLYDRAAKLSARYGVNIFIADAVPESLGAECFSERETVEACLGEIDSVLGCYPEGFFRCFPYGDFDRIYLYLTGTGLTAGSYRSGENELCIHIDANCLLANTDFFRYTLHHELGHMIDYRMHYDGDGHAPSIDEDIWNSFNPDGFEYVGADDDEQMTVYDGCFEYFVDSYGTCSPFEDRGELFGTAMTLYQNPGYISGVFELEHCQQKFDYFCRCIRSEFGLEDSTELLPWETAPANIAKN